MDEFFVVALRVIRGGINNGVDLANGAPPYESLRVQFKDELLPLETQLPNLPP